MKIGDKMPSFQDQDQKGTIIKTEDLLGKWHKIVLYTYPKDNTLGCTAEACSFRDAYDDLRAAGYTVIGVSKDSAKRVSLNASSTRSIRKSLRSRFSSSITNHNPTCYGKEGK